MKLGLAIYVVYRNMSRRALIDHALKQLASSSMFLVQNHSCRRGRVEDGLNALLFGRIITRWYQGLLIR